MGGIGVRQSLFPEHYPEKGGEDEYYDVEEENTSDVNSNIPDEVMEEVEKELEEKFKDYPKGMGFCHTYWYHKKQALANRGYAWKSPQDIADENPHSITFFD